MPSLMTFCGRGTLAPGPALLVALLYAAAAQPAQPQRWILQYHYESSKERLEIRDMVFASPERGVAAGVLRQGRSQKGVLIATRNSGKRWLQGPAPTAGRALFFLDAQRGWLVGEKGLWKTTDGGACWKQVKNSPQQLHQVYFVDSSRGWAIGAQKGAYTTIDGGETWERIPALAEVKTEAARTVFTAMSFHGRDGLIVGHSLPQAASKPRPLKVPEPLVGWPPSREVPHLMITLQTRDGGASWKASVASVFGTVTRVVFGPQGKAFALFRFEGEFPVPSELYAIDLTTGRSLRIFARRDRAITDIAVTSSGAVIVAGLEPPGEVNWGPLPGKVKVLVSRDLKNWEEMSVDYRAVARRAILAVVEDRAWLATDTGMILSLEGTPPASP